MAVKVCGHRVLIKVLDITDVDDQSLAAIIKSAEETGLYVPKTEQVDREQGAVDRGTVIQVGDTAFKDLSETPWCVVGDEIIFSRYAGKKITDPYTKENFTCINDEDVLIVITNKAEKE